MKKDLIALVGAGGTMGRRIAPNLKKFGYDFVCCEKDEAGLKQLSEAGYRAMSTDNAVKILLPAEQVHFIIKKRTIFFG